MKKTNKNLIAAAAAAILFTILPWQNANAASGQTDVTINFPNIIILYYIDALTLNFNPAIDQAVNEGGAADTQPLATPAAFDAGLTPGSSGIPGSIAVTVEDVWAVRGITASGQITVNPQIDVANATNGSSTATMSNLQVQSGTTGPADPISITAPGFGNAVLGDIVFDLDISGVTSAGSHTGMQYTIVATATP
jgi:hypothetical protein